MNFIDIPNSSGIYIIISSINNKKYIGSSSNLRKRAYKHISDIKNGMHPNPHLQNHINKYGNNILKFSVLEYCPIDILIKKEQFYIDKLNPEFNIRKKAESNVGIKRSQETRRKMSVAMKGKKKRPHFRPKFSEERKRNLSIKRKGIPHDHKIYKFYHYKYGIEICTQMELKKKYNLDSSSLSGLCNKRVNSCFAWKLI